MRSVGMSGVGTCSAALRPENCWFCQQTQKRSTAGGMHSPRPPSFPGVSRDAEEAAKGRDGYDFNGCSLRVELKRGAGPGGDRGGKRGQVPAFALGPLAPGVTSSLLGLCCSPLGLRTWFSCSVCKLCLLSV